MAKQVLGTTTDLIIIAKKNRLERSDSRLNEECFNYGKKSHYIRNCHSSTLNKRKSTEKSTKEAKHAQ